jgi:hypothetical protein
LRLANAPAPGKKIKCPKCAEVFVPALDDEADETPPAPKKPVARPAAPKATPPRRAEEESDEEAPAPPPKKKRPPVDEDESPGDEEEVPRKAAPKKPPRNEDDDEEENEERPKKGKRKPAKQGSNMVVLLAIGGLAAVVLLGAAVGGVLWALGVFDKKPTVAQGDPKKGPPNDPGKGLPFDPKKGPPLDPGQGNQPGSWQVAKFQELGWQAEFPTVPQKMDAGPKSTMYFAPLDWGTLSVTTSELQEFERDKTPKAILEDRLKFAEDVTNKKEITLKGHPGLEIAYLKKYGTGDREVREQLYVASKRFYRITVQWEVGHADPALTTRFFNSFQFTTD